LPVAGEGPAAGGRGTMASLKPQVEVIAENCGSLFLVRLLTGAAQKWISENVSGETTWFGRALVVEHRYIENLLVGMQEAGFRIVVR
jgi:hypothetical protein